MNKLYAITGISGSGKTSTMRQVMDNEIISFTTRNPRKGEIDGVDYNFTTKDKIEELELIGELVEKVEYRDNYYGITKEELKSKLDKGDAFVIVDYHGYLQLKQLHSDVTGIYIKADVSEVIDRMRERGDKEESIQLRLSSIEDELSCQSNYQYVVENKNGLQHKTVEKINEIINLNQNKPVLILDMDDVLADLIPKWVENVNKGEGENVQVHDIKSYDIDSYFKCGKKVFDYLTSDLYRKLKPIKGSQEAVKLLSKKYDIYVVTIGTSYKQSLIPKFEWLEEHFPEIPTSKLMLVGDKKQILGDVMIDDNPKHLSTFKGKKILFDCCHNKASYDYQRVDGWNDVLEVLL